MKCHDIDMSREERLGFPELVYGEFKTFAQLKEIAEEFKKKNKNLLITRLQREKAVELLKDYPDASYDELSGVLTNLVSPIEGRNGQVGIISAGTSDARVVEEAIKVLEFLGFKPTNFNDIGVAGMHRLMDKVEKLAHCDVLIVVAGFEGALPSVVGGVFSQPIIAVPTSVGYGVAEGGMTALNAMLSSCANGILVTNIDNGCGAALGAVRILRRMY